jgi:glycosyltransferase involved in cell wall biosynthesis
MTLVPTRELAEELRRDGIPHVQRLRRGVDVKLFDPERRSSALRTTWGVRDDTPVMLYVGRIAAEKNIELALQAFRILQSRLPDARMVVVGDGPQRAALEAASPDVHFAGARHGVALAEHYASADLFLFPSLTETFGNVVLEAMASGLPAVAFDRAAAREHIANGISGLVIPGSDARGFVSCAYALGLDCELRKQMGINARLEAQRCTPERSLAEFESLLYSLLREPGIDHACSIPQV